MKKENNENNPVTEPITEPVTEPKGDKFLENIPTKDDEILKRLDEVNQKLDSFTILDDDNDNDNDNDKKKNIGLALAFVALVVVVAGLFAFKKEVKNSNE